MPSLQPLHRIARLCGGRGGVCNDAMINAAFRFSAKLQRSFKRRSDGYTPFDVRLPPAKRAGDVAKEFPPRASATSAASKA
jgi:hypothetical protein